MRATGSHHPATLVNHWALMALTWCGVGYIIENGIQFDKLGNYLLVHCFGASQRVGSDIRLRFKCCRNVLKLFALQMIEK